MFVFSCFSSGTYKDLEGLRHHDDFDVSLLVCHDAAPFEEQSEGERHLLRYSQRREGSEKTKYKRETRGLSIILCDSGHFRFCVYVTNKNNFVFVYL